MVDTGRFATVIAGQSVFRNVSPTMDDDPDYVAGDVFGAKMEIENAVRFDGGGGVLNNIRLTSVDSLSAEDVDVILFDSDPANSTFTDNAQLALAAEDLSKIIGIVQLDTLFDLEPETTGGNDACVLQKSNIGMPVQAAGGSTSLFAVMVARAAIALSGTDGVNVGFGILRD